jgi:hypothetical protein
LIQDKNVIESIWLISGKNVAHVRENRNAYTVLGEKHEGTGVF